LVSVNTGISFENQTNETGEGFVDHISVFTTRTFIAFTRGPGDISVGTGHAGSAGASG
jgi:hypothetical protein